MAANVLIMFASELSLQCLKGKIQTSISDSLASQCGRHCSHTGLREMRELEVIYKEYLNYLQENQYVNRGNPGLQS